MSSSQDVSSRAGGLAWLRDLRCARNTQSLRPKSIVIETVDNPGWFIRMDLAGTIHANLDIPKQGQVLDTQDWNLYLARAGVFTCSGGPKSLVNLVYGLARIVQGTSLEGVDSHLEALMSWYAGNCDGDWEHSYGVKIEAPERGGWELEADLLDTAHATDALPRTESRCSDTDWTAVEIRDGVYRAAGGDCTLLELVSGLTAFIEGGHAGGF